MTDAQLYIGGAILVAVALIVSAAVRPSFVRAYWVTLRFAVWATVGYICLSYILEGISVMLGVTTLQHASDGRGAFNHPEWLLGLAMIGGVISLIGRLTVGRDEVPWFFGENDSSIFWGAVIFTFWFTMSSVEVAALIGRPGADQFKTTDHVIGLTILLVPFLSFGGVFGLKFWLDRKYGAQA